MQKSMQLTPIQLDSSNAITMSMGSSKNKLKLMMARSDVWHMIKIVRGAQHKRDEILKKILAAVEPAELIPVKYQIIGENTCFMVRNCGAALEKLCSLNLVIKDGYQQPLILQMTLGYASILELKINIQPQLVTVLAKRYNANRKYLNLECFVQDPDISKLAYCPLTQYRTFNHILKLAKSSLGPVERLNLQKNELTNLTAFETSELTLVKSLDLSHNQLICMSTLAPLKHMELSALWLDGNPLCENYSTPIKYIESARRYCPNLRQLDGVLIEDRNMPFTFTSSIKDKGKEQLIKSFVSHFFRLYDQCDRSFLRGLYCKDSIYSLSFGIPGAIAHKAGLGFFIASRNLLKKTDATKYIHYGQDAILAAIKKMPRLYHDQTTMVYDLMHDDGTYIVINVGGFVKKLEGVPTIMSFSRTFLLVARKENEYNVLNDQYHLDSAPENMVMQTNLSYEEFVPTCLSESEANELIAKFTKVTTLSKEWCVSYLDDAKWNIRKALSTFMKDYEDLNVPEHAFVR